MTTSQHQAIGREHRIALVAPDDFCAIIFCKPLCEELRRCGYQSLHTFSPVGTYAAELAGIPGVHTPIAMERFIAPIADARYIWHGARHYVELHPEVVPAHIFRLRRRIRTEQDFEYYL